MKSIKPGRGPSMMGAFGSAIGVLFGVFWTAMASSMGAPSFFSLFGVLFTIMGIGNMIYNFKNATGKNRMSVIDITDDNEEPDPLNEYFGRENEGPDLGSRGESSHEQVRNTYCPFCGTKLDADFSYCNSCGKKLPE